MASPRPALASEVRIPLTVDYITLREALKRQLYTGPGGRAPLWNGSDECQFLYAENPALSRIGAGVKFETAASLALGVAIADRCVGPSEWSGIVEANGTPYIAPGLKLKFHFSDVNLYNAQHERSMLASRGFDLIKNYMIPRLETFSYDLNPAVQQIGALAQEAAPPEAAERFRAAIATLTAEREISALDNGIRITLVMTVPDFATPTPTAGAAASPEAAPPALTPQEVERFSAELDQWDAFLVFAIKQLGGTVADNQFRDDLMKILLDSRFRLVHALQDPAANNGPDPVRVIFLDEWRQLGDTIRSAAERGMLGARSLEFLSFISAGDALFALDQAAPALGMRISAGDLRHLARIVAPKATGDPLNFNFNEDADLKKMFDVPNPPESPGPLDTSEAEAPATATETPTPVATPSASQTAGSPSTSTSQTPSPAPSQTSAPSPSPTPASTSMLRRWLAVFSPREACAAEPGLVPRLEATEMKLHRAVVTPDNADRYRDSMRELLDLSAERLTTDASGIIDARYRSMFPTLVKAAAWQESCWRQFVVVKGRVRWLESSTGDIGLMQVNKHVWRGFYSIERLQWDVLYNAGAGTEILARMLTYVAERRKDDPVPVPEHTARSVYAAYNGGPGSYNRWRGKSSRQERQIDALFLEKYRAMRSDQLIDILSCAKDWGHAPGH